MRREVRLGRPWIARLTLAAVLVGFVGLAARVVVTLAAPDLQEQKLAAAERFLYYRVTPTTGPLFELSGDETTIRLVTHAVVPAGASYDPALEYEYGVHLVLDLGGGKTWQRDVYTRSRQSKARHTSGKNPIWLDENTFALERGLELTDDRLLVIALPSHVPTGATVRITLLGDVKQGFVRGYAPIARDNPERRARDLSPEDRSRIAEQVSYLPWDRLTSPEDLASVRFSERRLSAEGKEDVDYQTHTLYTTGFRLRATTLTERGVLVTAARGATINVVGPAHVDLAITRPAALEATKGNLDVQLVGEVPPLAPPKPPLTIPLPAADGSVKAPLEVPAGVFTLTLTATAPARVEVIGPTTKQVSLGEQLIPDEQATAAYLSDARGAAVVIAIDGPPDMLSRVLRVDVRALASTPAPDVAVDTVTRWPAPATPGSSAPAGASNPPPSISGAAVAKPIAGTLTLDTLDADGRVLTTTTAKFESEPSRFDSAKLFGKLVANVCEPIGVHFLVPQGGRTVRLRTDLPALLQVMTPISLSPPADKLDVPYAAVPLVTLRWRYARYLERGWLALRAQNHDALMPDRVALVASQARLEARVVPPAPDVRGTSLEPPGGNERQTVIERVMPDDAADFIAKWDEGHYTRLVPGKSIHVDLGRLATRPSIRYRALGKDEAVAGAAVTIAIDGQPTDDHFDAGRGSLRLPAGLTGNHAITVKTAAPVELLLDRPPVKAGAELYALRSVYAIGGGHRVRLKVQKRSAAQQNINILMYAARPAADPATPVRVVIDGGAPGRIAGVALAMWTLADRTVPLPAADRPATLGFADMTGGTLYPRRLVVALGDDLPAGPHTVELAVGGPKMEGPGFTPGPGNDMWGRFFTLDNAPLEARALQWRTDTGEDNP